MIKEYMDMLFNLILAPCAVAYLLKVTLHSNLLAHVFDRWAAPDLYTREDFKNWTLEKWPGWLFDLIHCPTCLAFHFSWLLLLPVYSCFGSFGQFVISVFAVSLVAIKIHGPQTKVAVPIPKSPVEKVQEVDGEYVWTFGKKYKVSMVDGVKRQELVERDSDEASLLKFFSEEEYPAADAYILGLRKAYDGERSALEKKAAEDSTVCSPCQLNGLQNKYYQKLKEHIRNASSDS